MFKTGWHVVSVHNQYETVSLKAVLESVAMETS